MSSNITNLRKAGNLDAAYQLAKKNLDERCDDIWCRRDIAWVYHDYAKKKATVETRDQFLRCIDKIIELDMPPDEEMLHNSAMFLVRGMAATMIRAEKQDNAFFDALIDRAKLLKTKKKTPAFSALMTVMLRAKEWWRGYKDFVEWCGWDCYMDEDFNGVEMADGGGKKIMPLAERILMAYCKCLLDRGTAGEIESFLPMLDDFARQHRNYVYLPFYSAKLLWKAGRRDEYFAKMKVFARKKSGEFWVWDLLGDYFDDEVTRLKFYAKGLTCRVKAEMSVKLREKTAFLLMRTGHLAEALCELNFIVKIRERNKWHITPDIVQAINDINNKGVSATKNNSAFYVSVSAGVEELVFGRKIVGKPKQKEDRFDFEGKVTVSPGGFGFVRFDGKSIFVPAKLISDRQIVDKSVVKGKYVKSFDKKKGKDGYRAVDLKSALL